MISVRSTNVCRNGRTIYYKRKQFIRGTYPSLGCGKNIKSYINNSLASQLQKIDYTQVSAAIQSIPERQSATSKIVYLQDLINETTINYNIMV